MTTLTMTDQKSVSSISIVYDPWSWLELGEEAYDDDGHIKASAERYEHFMEYGLRRAFPHAEITCRRSRLDRVVSRPDIVVQLRCDCRTWDSNAISLAVRKAHYQDHERLERQAKADILRLLRDIVDAGEFWHPGSDPRVGFTDEPAAE